MLALAYLSLERARARQDSPSAWCFGRRHQLRACVYYNGVSAWCC